MRSFVSRGIALGLALALAVPPIGAQDSAPPDATPAVAREDPASPRAALRGFLEAARQGDHAAAARWLETGGVAGARAAQLAERLDAVLARFVPIDLDAVSGAAEGDPDDLPDPRHEFIGLVPNADGGRDTVRLVRSGRGATAWRVPARTVQRIDGWYARLPNPWIRARLPEPLVREGPLGVQWWQWIAIAAIPATGALLGWLLARPLGIVARRLVSRTAASWDDRFVDRLAGPVRLGFAAVASSALLRLLGLPLGVERSLVGLARGAGLLALFWALLRGTRLLERTLERGHWGGTPQGRSIIPLLGRLLRAVLLLIGILVALAQFGYPVGTVLAGLGIGGIAVALAAQKTIENLFGSVSLAADRAFRVGDWVSIEGTSGSVEQIGLRSTAIRTIGRSVVRIPNGKLADMRIENFGVRDRIVLSTTLALAHTTTMAQLRRIRAAWTDAVRASPGWHEPSGVTVRFTGFVDAAPQLLVEAWFATADIGQFRLWQEALLETLHAIVEREGTTLALPARRVVGEAAADVPAADQPAGAVTPAAPADEAAAAGRDGGSTR